MGPEKNCIPIYSQAKNVGERGKKLSKRGITPKPEMNYRILIYVTTLLLINT